MDHGRLTTGHCQILRISLTCPATKLGIGEELFEEMAAHAVKTGGPQHAYVPLNRRDVLAILKMCL